MHDRPVDRRRCPRTHQVGTGSSTTVRGVQREFSAFVTRGLEDIAAGEIGSVKALRALEVRSKVVLAQAADPRAFRHLRTVDDVAVVSARSDGVAGLDNLTSLVADGADLEESIEIAKRTDRMEGTFSITVSAAHTACGPANLIEDAVASVIKARYGWEHVRLQRAPVDIRVFIDGRWALIGVRLFDEPLSRRSYRVVNVRGALRPTVAAALVRIATPNPRRRQVWDPFCGSGTILCEAAEAGHEVWGTDIELEAVDAARENLTAVKREFWGRIENADSTSPKTWKKHQNATTVISNLPWGKQVGIKSRQALYDSVGSGVADLARRGGIGVLLTTEPELVRRRLRPDPGLTVDERRIGLLGQTPTVITVRPVG
jgi:tRNA (guanine6-N2)-methyltransferase